MVKKQIRKIRPWMIVLGVLVFFLIFPIMYIIGSNSISDRLGVCETKECFMTAANSCENATFYSQEDIGFVMYETKECFFVKTLLETNEDEIQEVKDLIAGKSLICQYSPEEFDSRWISSISEGLESCQGDLKEAIGELIVFSAP